MRRVRVRCSCGKLIAVSARHRGLVIKCRQCGSAIRVPDAARLSVDGVRAFVRDWRHSFFTPTVVWRAALAYLALSALAAAVLWGFGDAWWPGTILLFIGRWPLLLPLLVLVPAAVARRRIALVPLALGALVIVGPVMGVRSGWRTWFSGPPNGGTPFRVVTFNANVGDALAIRLPLLLDEWRADVVALQECGPILADAVAREPRWYSHQVRGLCLMSRHPIVDTAVMDRTAFARVREAEDEGIGGAADVVRYRLATPAGDVYVTNLHLETPRKGIEGILGAFQFGKLRDNTALRGFESQHASRWATSAGAPVIVVGDFNTPVESRIYRANWGSLTNAFSRVGVGLGATRLNGWIRVRIDHVLTGAGVAPVRVALGAEVESDHLPVIADLIITK